MLEFEEYKVKLNNLKPELEELYTSLGLEQAKREVEELEIKSSQPGFWDNPEESQKIVSRMGSLKGKVEAYNKMTELCDDLLTICEMAIEENDESMLEELESGYKELEDALINAYAAVGVKLNHHKAVSLITTLRNKRMIVQENGRKYTFMPDFHY